MKTKTLLSMALILLSTSCDSPRSQRSLSGQSSSTLTNSANSNPVNLDNNTTTTTTSSGNTTTTTGTSSTTSTVASTSIIPSDASQCKFATDGITGFESTSTHLGDYTLCQSSTDKDSVYFQLKTPPTNSKGDVRICFFPTTNTGSSSIYIGNPQCGLFKNPKDIRKLTFIKHPQFSNATITGVIFFKELTWTYPVYYLKDNWGSYRPYYNIGISTLDAYESCMNMLNEIGNSINCSYFKTLNQYIYKQF